MSKMYDYLIVGAGLYGAVFARQAADAGYTMILVSHEMNFVRKVANRVIFLENGHIIEDGTPQEIFSHPKSERLRQFIAKIERLSEPDYVI